MVSQFLVLQARANCQQLDDTNCLLDRRQCNSQHCAKNCKVHLPYFLLQSGAGTGKGKLGRLKVGPLFGYCLEEGLPNVTLTELNLEGIEALQN